MPASWNIIKLQFISTDTCASDLKGRVVSLLLLRTYACPLPTENPEEPFFNNFGGQLSTGQAQVIAIVAFHDKIKKA